MIWYYAVSLRKGFNKLLHFYMTSQALELNEKKLKILSYVESRMSFIAPNLSTILGPTVATKLMGEEQEICTMYAVTLAYHHPCLSGLMDSVFFFALPSLHPSPLLQIILV